MTEIDGEQSKVWNNSEISQKDIQRGEKIFNKEKILKWNLKLINESKFNKQMSKRANVVMTHDDLWLITAMIKALREKKEPTLNSNVKKQQLRMKND